MATNTYDIGDAVTEHIEFESASILTDPTTVNFTYQKPDGSEFSLLYGTDAVTRDAEGVYHVTLVPDLPGLWRFRWTGSGNLDAMEEGAFYMLSSFGEIIEKFAPVELMAAYLAEEIDPADILALGALEGATKAIKKYCRQEIALVMDDTVVLDGSGIDTLLLPDFPVIDVSSVIENPDLDSPRTLVPPGNGSNSEYSFSLDSGLLFRARGQFILWENRFAAKYGVWPDRRQSVQVTYSHGYASIPMDIQMVCVAIAARAFAQDGATTENTGTYTATYAGQPSTITADEKRILDQYRARRK